MGPEPTSRRFDSRLLALAAFCVLVTALLLYRAASQWLGGFTPDGAFEPRTARFLDAGVWIWALAGLTTLAAASSAGLRRALAGGWQEPEATGAALRLSSISPWLAPSLGLFAVLLRLVLAGFADIGLGDDGARVVWLQQWLEAPHLVWSGLWLPAHLYLHALFYLFVRDAVWSGVLLSAVAAGGTVWILARAVQARWGDLAASLAGALAALLPVSLAYGANPDVNPVFAFFIVAATAALLQAREASARDARHSAVAGVPPAQVSHGFRWFFLAWFCLFIATWMRFDAIVLVFALAALLLPRWRAVALFALAASLPFVAWNVAQSRLSHGTGNVMSTVQEDPTLGGSLVSVSFDFLGALWLAVTLPVIVLSLAGALRAWGARAGRGWILPALAHLAALAGTTLVFHAGTQPRYYILVGSIAAAFAGVGLAGIAARSRAVGWATAMLAAILLVVTPQLYPDESDLWLRRNPELRQLVDEVDRRSEGGHVVWVSQESGYFYACRARPPIQLYHALPRADSEPQTVLDGLRDADTAIACVEQRPLPRERWQRLLALAGRGWLVEPLADHGDYRLFAMYRVGAAQVR